MAKAVLPRVHVLVICDDIEDRWEADSLFDLLGVRTQLQASLFPHTCPQLCAYAQVTGHEGTSVCRVVVVRAENDEEIDSAPEAVIDFTGPRDFIILRFWLVDCKFPAAGVYYVQMYFDGKLCSERTFEVFESEGETDGRDT